MSTISPATQGYQASPEKTLSSGRALEACGEDHSGNSPWKQALSSKMDHTQQESPRSFYKPSLSAEPTQRCMQLLPVFQWLWQLALPAPLPRAHPCLL